MKNALQLEPNLDDDLDTLAADLVDALVSARLAVREGEVRTLAGDPPYRRLDCDGRALAYIRTRPKKRAVRVDVSGLWSRPRVSGLRVRTASGGTALLIRNAHDVGEAAAYLREAVARTREGYLRERRRRLEQMLASLPG